MRRFNVISIISTFILTALKTLHTTVQLVGIRIYHEYVFIVYTQNANMFFLFVCLFFLGSKVRKRKRGVLRRRAKKK